MSAQLSRSTPGPWIAAEDQLVRGGPHAAIVADVGFGASYDQGAANCRLIIAVHDLLAIVQTIAALLDQGVPSALILDENSPTVDAIRAVLAKVSGGAE